MSFSPLIDRLIEALRCLPGVGPKSAQRMAFNILERNRAGGEKLAQVLLDALRMVGNCLSCRIFCEEDLCRICSDSSRDNGGLCVVETPADVLAVEQSRKFNGRYFVLMGHLSPIDGIGPEELGIDIFEEKLKSGKIIEVIMATNTTIEGETTAYYLAELTKKYNAITTRIALGVPLGGELEHVDGGTLARALEFRSKLII